MLSPSRIAGTFHLLLRLAAAAPRCEKLRTPMQNIGIAIIGCGGVTLQNHLPGIALCADTKLVALCDANAETLERAQRDTGITIASKTTRKS